ncbi:MAG TPA: glycine cleavage system protein GcvH [Mycobacteriales bacterium]
MSTPTELKYTAEHEWAKVGPDGRTIRVGVTDFAQNALGDVVFVSLPAVDTDLEKGQPMGEVESTKSVSDVYAPASGTVAARNDALDEHPELINSDPYGDGWLVEITVTDTSALEDMLDAEAYQKTLDPQ